MQWCRSVAASSLILVATTLLAASGFQLQVPQ